MAPPSVESVVVGSRTSRGPRSAGRRSIASLLVRGLTLVGIVTLVMTGTAALAQPVGHDTFASDGSRYWEGKRRDFPQCTGFVDQHEEMTKRLHALDAEAKAAVVPQQGQLVRQINQLAAERTQVQRALDACTRQVQNQPLQGHAAMSSVTQPGPTSDAPLDWIPNSLNAIVSAIPDGAQRLQDALWWSNEIRKPLEDTWTKDPYGGIKQVGTFYALKGAGQVVGSALGAAASKFASTPAGKALAALKDRARGPGKGGGGGAGPPAAPGLTAPPSFNAQIDRGTQQALRSFARGTQGTSVKNLSGKIADKTVQEIDDIVGDMGGGWRPPDANGVVRSVDGTWTRIETTSESFGQKFPMRFYANNDGGVLRVKPEGMHHPDFPKLKAPHAAAYVKKDPTGSLDFDNEAFKVLDDVALPKWPNDMQVPAGLIPKTPPFEAWLQRTGWPSASHIPVQP